MDLNRHIWEGWTVGSFIEELEITFQFQNFKSREEVIKWCKNEQPYYKKHIPEVSKYFIKKSGL